MVASTPFDLLQEQKDLADFLKQEEESVNMAQWSRGDIVEATVLEVTDRDVLFDIGQKQDGRCPVQEFDGPPPAGSVFQVVVKSEAGSEGNTIVSKLEADRRVAWGSVVEAHEHGTKISGIVEKEISSGHGYIVRMGGLGLFMPRSQADLKARSRAKLKPGTVVDFKVIEVNDKKRSAVVSRRAILEEVNHELWNEFQQKHNEGDVVKGAVTRKVSFGVFVNVDGIEGLLHQSDISWKKFAPFKDRFQIGQEVELKILQIDQENHRLSLGLKQMSEDPWEWASRELHSGSVVKGTVTSLTDYGAFVEIKEGLEGLIHVSELSWSKKLRHPKRYLEVGQEVEAQVLSLDFEKQRIGLGLKQLQKDPWESLGSDVKEGDVREGEVTSVTKFGAFVKILDDVEGLIHFNDYSWDDHPDRKMLKKGDNVQYKILNINKGERRVSCGIKQLTPSPYEVLKEQHKKNSILKGKVTSITDFGIFVDIGDGFEGLVHISRIPLRQDQKLSDLYKPGDEVNTVLLRIDSDEKRISLSIKDYERKQQREIIDQYLKKDDAPSTSSLGSLIKKLPEN
ncbi:MAG: 30S ribosomal protein S1 [Leptospiraceae bacterium]|nr:30S ribosomal protein S1 [Leptospiraceae bacterium]MCB1303991.1 30S ribosomal protein S1 [Leptospiraceae bacterium]